MSTYQCYLRSKQQKISALTVNILYLYVSYSKLLWASSTLNFMAADILSHIYLSFWQSSHSIFSRSISSKCFDNLQQNITEGYRLKLVTDAINSKLVLYLLSSINTNLPQYKQICQRDTHPYVLNLAVLNLVDYSTENSYCTLLTLIGRVRVFWESSRFTKQMHTPQCKIANNGTYVNADVCMTHAYFDCSIIPISAMNLTVVCTDTCSFRLLRYTYIYIYICCDMYTLPYTYMYN